MMPSMPCSSHVSEYYLEWMTEHDVEVRKVVYAKEGTSQCDSSQSGKKIVKDPNPQKTTPLIIKDKKLMKD